MVKQRVAMGVVAVLAMVIVAILALRQTGDKLNRGKSSDNLRALGQALLLYTNDTRGIYPPDWGTLAMDTDIPPVIFLSPAGNTSAPTGLNWSQQCAWVTAHSDYIYLGANAAMGSEPNFVMACEKPETNHGDGINILFHDGRTAFFEREEAQKIIDQLNAHENPPHLESQGKHLGFK